MSEFDYEIPDESEQLDQLDAADSLIERGVGDPLDEGIVPTDRWSPAQGFGNTPAEALQGETIEIRLPQEEPEPIDTWSEDEEEAEHEEGREVGATRAGRLVDTNHGYPGEDRESELLAEDVGIDGAGATAEEAAMHVIEDDRRAL
ncbi:DUF5709 domain-containing protein [Granulicoccus phenolivorans]|uniref:DUF5709 domain-containing protein n=1 Tax=Granulicoccus phenolivorans TaxID=266854 RepID=UPI00040C631D|nr:DUF5709 domain-containing protein [Granulicoccus phenolivorans]